MVGSRKVSLQFSLNWLWSLGGLAAVLILTFTVGPETWRSGLVFIASVLGGTAALVVALNAIDSRLAAIEQSKKTAALDFVHRWNDPKFFHAKKNSRETIKEIRTRPQLEDQKAYIEGEADRLANLLDVFNLFECLAVAIETHMADEEIARRFFRSILLEYWHSFEGYVKLRRAERQNARILCEVEWLFQKWKS